MGNILTALSRTFKDLLNIRKKDIDSGLQAVAKSTRSRSANYLSVQTLDPVRLGSAFSVADNGDICLDSCLTDTEESFDPRLVHTVIDVILRHLTEEYPNLMSLVWAK